MRLAALACAAAVLAGCAGAARSPASAQAWNVEHAIAALEANDCAAAWQQIWPAARSGNVEAVSVLGGGLYAYGLTPPDGATDVLAQLRGTLAVYGQAARSGESHATEFLAALLADDFFDEGNGKAHATCLLSEADPDGCVDAAQAAGLVPRFAAWAAHTDRIAAHAEAPAHCSRP